MKAAAPTAFASVLEEYGDLTRRALPHFLPRGPIDNLIADYPNRGGKMMRPALCIATARILGAPPETAVRAAVSIEMLHNALLIYDDIQDESLQRRGKPALHHLHGIPLALTAANALTLLSLRPLLETPQFQSPTQAHRVMREVEIIARESAEGQALELGWRRENRFDLMEGDYLEMVLKKTCWFATIYPLRLGALIALGEAAEAEALVRFGFFLGAAFQIQDDLLNLLATGTQYGKELAGDLWEGKRTLMLIRLYQESDPGDRRRLTEIFEKPREDRSRSEILWLQRRMEELDCYEYARCTALALVEAAAVEFTRFFGPLPPSRDKAFLEQTMSWVVRRGA
jgi:geranylgeranyl diphosphate synthase type II